MANNLIHCNIQDFMEALEELGKDNYTKARHEAGLYTKEEVQIIIEYYVKDMANFAIEKGKKSLQELTDGFVEKSVQVVNHLLHKDVDLQTIEEVKNIFIG